MSYMPNAYQYAAYKRELERNTPEALTALVDSGALQGTLAVHPYNGAIYWHYNTFPHGIPDSLDSWLYLGSLGWYPSEAGKVLFIRVRELALQSDMWPQYPGEYASFPPQLALNI